MSDYDAIGADAQADEPDTVEYEYEGESAEGWDAEELVPEIEKDWPYGYDEDLTELQAKPAEPAEEATAAERLVKMTSDAGLPEDVSRTVVMELLRLRAANDEAGASRERIRANLPYVEFVKKFPDADVKNLPGEVLEAAAGGGDMQAAYLCSMNARLSARLGELESDRRAAFMSAGSAAGSGGAARPDEGWMSFMEA